MAVDSTLILVDSIVTLPTKQDVVILKQPKYLSPKPTEQSFEVLEKSPISPQASKRFTKYLKNKPFKKNSEFTDGETLIYLGCIIISLSLSVIMIYRIKSFRQANLMIFIALGVLSLYTLMFLTEKDNTYGFFGTLFSAFIHINIIMFLFVMFSAIFFIFGFYRVGQFSQL